MEWRSERTPEPEPGVVVAVGGDVLQEFRSATLTDMDVGQWSGGFRFEGLAAVFDEPWENEDLSETIQHGAFRKALGAGHNVPMLYNHGLLSDQVPLATTAAGTLKLEEVGRGLHVTADVADTQLGRDVRTSAKRGDIRWMSYGMATRRGDSKVEKRDGKWHRTITNIRRILDVSPTWDPAHQGTVAQFRSMALAEKTGLDPVQQFLLGDHPQPEEKQGTETEVEHEPVEEETQQEDESGADWEAQYAARNRQLTVMAITLGGSD